MVVFLIMLVTDACFAKVGKVGKSKGAQDPPLSENGFGNSCFLGPGTSVRIQILGS